ncbi:hypothetical protein B0T19DRAFT_415432 [Cercophora scortea]|uniref:Uncharacterized protein n=1 Tax=Cercophora scortea TaxID=314031 RepID=A0AAE0MH22_9PEZI|nr:hypothetical protein B0T19DRAFT_415432 [Cercophora scortea]
MASRRLKSDRFIAGGKQWGEEMYTAVEFRHFPELKGVLDMEGNGNVFAPWGMLAGSKGYKGVETSAPKGS